MFGFEVQGWFEGKETSAFHSMNTYIPISGGLSAYYRDTVLTKAPSEGLWLHLTGIFLKNFLI